MKFSMALLIFIIIGFILCIVFGPAAVLVWGVVFTLILTVIGEVNRTKTKEGREQMAKERQEEEDYVNYWGSTQYWEDQEDDDED